TSLADFFPAGLPPGAADAAHSTLGAALETARQMGGQAGETLARACRDSFARGMQGAAWVAAGGCLAAAIWVRRAFAAAPGTAHAGPT
ncbi:MAG TPA: hypothetical protein VLI46_05560, partial [Ramlibacter sp.]|nr:hypothetical protein [Ramlibacter sp.]